MTYVSDKLSKYIRNRQPDFLKIKVVELLPYLPCLTQMDLETINACVRNDGNERAVPLLLDCCTRRKGWETQLIQALAEKEYIDLANDLEQEFQSLTGRGSGITSSQRLPSASPKAKPSAPAHHSHFPYPPPTSTPATTPQSPALVLPSLQEGSDLPSQPVLQPSMPASAIRSSFMPENSSPLPPSDPTPSAPQLLSPESAPDLSVAPTNPRSSSPTSTLNPFSPAPVPSSIPCPSSPSPSPAATCQDSTATSDLQTSEGLPAPALKVLTPSSTEPGEVSLSSDQLKIPIQEMGDMKSKPSLASTDKETQKLPIQENIIICDQWDPPDSRPPQNPVTETDESMVRVKPRVVAPSDQSTGASTVPANWFRSSGSVPEQSDENSYNESIQKPGVLQHIQSDNRASSNVSPCSIRLSELQISSSIVQTSGNDTIAASPPTEVCSNTDPNTSGASPADSDDSVNSLKEQKLQALRGYQNDNLEHSIYDVNKPYLIQENFDAEKKLGKMVEGRVTAEEGVKIKSGSVFESEPLFVQRSTTEVAHGTQPDAEISDDKGAISTQRTTLLVSTDHDSEGIGQVIQGSVRGSDAPEVQVSRNRNQQGVLDKGLIVNRRVASESTFNHDPATHDGEALLIARGNISYNLNGSRSVSQDVNGYKAGISESGGFFSNGNDGSKVHCVGEKGGESCAEDIRVHTGHINEGAFSDNQAGSDRRFAAMQLTDPSSGNSGGGYVNSMSNVPQPIVNTSGQNSAMLSSASQERLTGKKPVESNKEPPHSYSMMRSATVVAMVAFVIGCLWKYCRK